MEPPSSRRVSVINESGVKLPTASIKRAVQLALSNRTSVNASVCVLLSTDEVIRGLNHKFRDIDEPTDVISFKAASMPGAPLGDIAIAVPFAQRQAASRGVSLDTELCYLAIHGALHLVGYEDETDPERSEMQREMSRVGQALGLDPDAEWSSLL